MSKEKQDEEFDFSKSFNKLEDITEKFENDDFELEEGIEKFEEGIKLANKLKQRLQDAENKVEKIKEDFAENQ
jgi:exodeoxyribonuclease VII small subunit